MRLEGKRLGGKRKAISPIIATLILIVIAVVAGIMLYGFVTGYMSKVTSSTGTFSGSQLALQAASISPYNTTAYTVSAVVTNTGSTNVTVTAINVLYVSNNSLIGSNSTVSYTVKPGSTKQISGIISPISIPNSGTPVVVQVTTSGGGYVEYQTTWP